MIRRARSALGLAAAYCALAVAHAALRLIGLSRAAEWFPRDGVLAPGTMRDASSGWLVRADRHFFASEPSCLRRALAYRILAGSSQALNVGVRRAAGGRIEAHAWTGPAGGADAGFEELAAL